MKVLFAGQNNITTASHVVTSAASTKDLSMSKIDKMMEGHKKSYAFHNAQAEKHSKLDAAECKKTGKATPKSGFHDSMCNYHDIAADRHKELNNLLKTAKGNLIKHLKKSKK